MQLKIHRKVTIGVIITVILFCILVPFSLFSIANNLYAANYAQTQVIQSYKDSMTLYLKMIDDNYRQVETNLGALINQNLSDIYTAEQEGSSNDLYMARQRLRHVFEQNALMSNSMDGIFLYNRPSGRYMDVAYASTLYNNKQTIQDSLIRSFQSADQMNTAKWHIREIEGKYYVFRILAISKSYLGVYIGVDAQLAMLRQQSFVSLNDVVFLDSQYRNVTGQLLGKPVHTAIVLDSNRYVQDGVEYFLVHVPLAKADLILASLIKSDTMMAGFNSFRRILLLLILTMLLLIPVFYSFLRRFVLKPLSNLAKAMHIFMTGDFSIRLTDNMLVKELDIVSTTFNCMANEVKELKIVNYENQLEKQRIKLQYYQMQIRPHFLINTLNMISTLAQAKSCNRIQDLSMFLAAYFRYTLKTKGTFVCLKDELQHAVNYLNIQKLRYPGKLEVVLRIEEQLYRASVLPLMLQTFVENCIQHAVSMDEVTVLQISANLAEDKRMNLAISDSGPGFPQEFLASIENKELSQEDGRHIGISNIKERLALAYADQAEMLIGNAPEGGALIRIVIPFVPYEQ